MIKKIKIVMTLILGITINQQVLAQDSIKESDKIVGIWLMQDNQGIIEIFKENQHYSGKIIWMLEKEMDGSLLKDKENPVDSLKTRAVVGLKVIKNFNFVGDNIWSGGTFYAAKMGKVVEPDLLLVTDNILNIEISFFLFSKTIKLTRFDSMYLKFLK